MAALVLLIVLVVCFGIVAYGWFEAGWLRTRVIEVEIPELPAALDGLTIGHLSDFHLGAPFSRGNAASSRAVAWIAERHPDLVCVTGDLVSHPRGERRLAPLLKSLRRPFVVLGNHDVAETRDPFSRMAELRDLGQSRLLRDQAETVDIRGERVCVAGIDPTSYRARRARPEALADPAASFRILLCHFPSVLETLPDGLFGLVLAGHLHAGQISLRWPRRRVTLAHPRARFVSGVYRIGRTVHHVSPGSGTTFVPFRFFARPEATELVLRAPGTESGGH